MNVDRINQLADYLDTDPDGFRMCQYYNACGTPACIAGHTSFIFKDEARWEVTIPKILHMVEGDNLEYVLALESLDNGESIVRENHYFVAQLLLDLDPDSAHDLFIPMTSQGDYSVTNKDADNYITSRHAAAVLRHLAKTGKVDWSLKPIDKAVFVIDEEVKELTAA